MPKTSIQIVFTFNVVFGIPWLWTPRPVKLAGVHAGLDEGDDGVDLHVDVGLEQLLTQNFIAGHSPLVRLVHRDVLKDGLVQGPDLGKHFLQGLLAIVHAHQQLEGVARASC